MDSEQVTAVQIYNRTYMLRSGGNPEYVKELARFVDEKMTELARSTPTVDSLKIAILAALSIADECLTSREEKARLEEAIREKGTQMLELLEAGDCARSR